MNPEFLRECNALYDFFNPDRIIIGESNKESGDMLNKLFSDFKAPILRTSPTVAETIKYTSNAFLSMKVSFANEMANICKKLNIDVYAVMEGVGMDKRISPHFLRAGCGFGGSCFKKDVLALIQKSDELGYESKLLKSVINLNDKQALVMIDLLKKHTKLKDANVAVLGLSFKPNTDDIRDAPSLRIITRLISEGAKVIVFDPKAMRNTKKIFNSKIEYAKTAFDAVSSLDFVLIVTEWDEFRNKNLYKDKIVIDGRKIKEAKIAKIYEGVGW